MKTYVYREEIVCSICAERLKSLSPFAVEENLEPVEEGSICALCSRDLDNDPDFQLRLEGTRSLRRCDGCFDPYSLSQLEPIETMSVVSLFDSTGHKNVAESSSIVMLCESCRSGEPSEQNRSEP